MSTKWDLQSQSWDLTTAIPSFKYWVLCIKLEVHECRYKNLKSCITINWNQITTIFHDQLFCCNLKFICCKVWWNSYMVYPLHILLQWKIFQSQLQYFLFQLWQFLNLLAFFSLIKKYIICKQSHTQPTFHNVIQIKFKVLKVNHHLADFLI